MVLSEAVVEVRGEGEGMEPRVALRLQKERGG